MTGQSSCISFDAEGEALAAERLVMAGRSASRPFVKMHGLRNNFVIFDNRVDHRSFPVADIIRICDTQVGVGGDQLLTIERPSQEGDAAGACAAMRIFNIDGREVSACGNATRCVAHLMLEETGLSELVLETGGGMLKCRRAGTMQVSVEMAAMSTDWRKFPVSHEIDMLHVPVGNGPLRDGLAVWIGNPHVVHFVERLSEIDMPAVAPAIQNDPLFPEGVNIGAAEIVDHETIRLAVWERPGILTGACGTGACVAAYAARLRGLSQSSRFTVHLPAGALTIDLIDANEADGGSCGMRAVMTGPVAYCCRGTVDFEA